MHKITKIDTHIKVKSLLNFMFVISILLCSQFVDYVHLDTDVPPTEEQGNWHMYRSAYSLSLSLCMPNATMRKHRPATERHVCMNSIDVAFGERKWQREKQIAAVA